MSKIFKQIGRSVTSLGSGPVADLNAMMKGLDQKDSSKRSNGKDLFVALVGATLLEKAAKLIGRTTEKAASKIIYFKK